MTGITSAAKQSSSEAMMSAWVFMTGLLDEDHLIYPSVLILPQPVDQLGRRANPIADRRQGIASCAAAFEALPHVCDRPGMWSPYTP